MYDIKCNYYISECNLVLSLGYYLYLILKTYILPLLH
jgi:hypothetical protein